MYESRGAKDLHGSDEEEVCLGILEGFEELRPFPPALGRHGLVLPDPLDCDALLSLAEPSRVGLVVGHQVQDEQRVREANRAEEEENDFPRSDGSMNCKEGINQYAPWTRVVEELNSLEPRP